jgi:pyruvate/2-oxoglutarate dehydrogenase complex dihydrolipoamide acyltransferase (E2) component
VFSASLVDRIPVFATTIVEPKMRTAYPLLRRIVDDKINATILMKGVDLDGGEVELGSVLAALEEEGEHEPAGGLGVAGVWVPLARARELASKYTLSGHLDVFLHDDLAKRFPEPLPQWRQTLRAAAPSSPPKGGFDALPPPPTSANDKENVPETVALAFSAPQDVSPPKKMVSSATSHKRDSSPLSSPSSRRRRRDSAALRSERENRHATRSSTAFKRVTRSRAAAAAR